MSLGLLADLLLAAAILCVAVAVVRARQPFTAVALFIAYGLLLTLAWMRLEAVDVALTEGAIGAGLSGVLLLVAIGRLGQAPAAPMREAPGPAAALLIGLGCAGVAAALAAAVLTLPMPAPGLAAEVAANLAPTGLGNPVTAVLMVFRGLDTLLESAVLVLAVVGVWALAPEGGWGGMPGAIWPAVRSGPLALLARSLPPLGMVIAVHILWAGADGPGGKFQAGAILAAMWILAWIAGLARPPAIGSRGLRLVLAAGPALFIAVGLAGLLLDGAFLAYPDGWAKPLIKGIEVVMTASVAAALALLVMGPPTEGMHR